MNQLRENRWPLSLVGVDVLNSQKELATAGVHVFDVMFAEMMIIIVSPFFGAVLAGLIMGIILIIIGIEMISAGIGGRQTRLTPPGLKRE